MRPINSKYFGDTLPTSLTIQFYNGTNTVNGFILRQIGTSRYIVSDNTNVITVQLAQDTASAAVAGGIVGGTLVVGVATIAYNTGSGWLYVKKLTSKLAYMTDGTVYPWVVVGQTVPSGGIALSSPF